jgi:DNA polymerase (family 10)
MPPTSSIRQISTCREKTLEELEQIEGIGKSIAAKINELQTTKNLKELSLMLAKTPLGVIEMLRIKGIGPKKVGQLWRELEIESTGELLYACSENRLVTLKGFGAKTQETVKKQIEFFQSNVGKFHYASVENFAMDLVLELKKQYGTDLVSLTGAMRRKSEIIDVIEILVGTDKTENKIEIENVRNVKVELIFCSANEFYSRLFETTGTTEHLSQISSPPSDVFFFRRRDLQLFWHAVY